MAGVEDVRQCLGGNQIGTMATSEEEGVDAKQGGVEENGTGREDLSRPRVLEVPRGGGGPDSHNPLPRSQFTGKVHPERRANRYRSVLDGKTCLDRAVRTGAGGLTVRVGDALRTLEYVVYTKYEE